MPIYLIRCDKCDHQFKSLVFANTQEPKEWVCSRCGSHEAKPAYVYDDLHPLENNHGAGCPCCGGISGSLRDNK